MNDIFFNIILISTIEHDNELPQTNNVNIGHIEGDPVISGINNGSVMNIKNNKNWQDDILLYIVVGIIIAVSAYFIIKMFSN